MNAKQQQQQQRSFKQRTSMRLVTSSMEAQMIHDKSLIARFMSNSDAPAWYRGSSERQMFAADSLWCAIRDDAEQGTAHRVRNCLWSIGIYPLVSIKETKFLMKLSQGNDLAFLWFLMEIHYKTRADGKYNINEQLILSAIMHLDMVTTLRELDRIMPPGHASKRMIEQRERRIEQSRSTQVRIRNSFLLRKKNLNPYFNKLERPVEYRKPLAVEAPYFKVNLSLYEKANDPNYISQNEANRWYATYPLHKGARITRRLLNGCVSDVIDVLPSTSTSQATVAGNGEEKQKRRSMQDVLQQRKKMSENGNKAQNEDENQNEKKAVDVRREQGRDQLVVPEKEMISKEQASEEMQQQTKIKQSPKKKIRLQTEQGHQSKGQKLLEMKNHTALCSCHRGQEQQRQLEKIKFLIEKKNRFLKCTDPASNERQLRHQRVLAALEREINKYRLHNKRYRSAHRANKSSVRVLCKDGSYREYLVGNSFMGTCEDVTQKSIEEHEYKVELKSSPSTIERTQWSPHKPSTINVEVIKVSEGRAVCCHEVAPASNTPEPQYIYKPKQCSSFNRNENASPNEDMAAYFERYDRGYNSATPNSSQRYFEAPLTHKPHCFNYEKIFRYKDNDDLRAMIKNHCTEALGADLHRVKKLTDLTPDLAAAASQCAQDIWVDATKDCLSVPSSMAKTPEDPYPPDMPRRSFYDCEDVELMNEMLRIALEHMSMNPKFVLASLPDAHKVPVLREWVYQRYGKRYTKSQQIASLNESLKILKAIMDRKLDVRTPHIKEMGRAHFLDYSCFPYVLRKSQKLKETYYNSVRKAIMEQCRIFWFAMRSHLCSGGRAHRTFFAYMPSRFADIKLFQPWKCTEYTDMNFIRKKRRRSA